MGRWRRLQVALEQTAAAMVGIGVGLMVLVIAMAVLFVVN